MEKKGVLDGLRTIRSYEKVSRQLEEWLKLERFEEVREKRLVLWNKGSSEKHGTRTTSKQRVDKQNKARLTELEAMVVRPRR